MNQQNRLSHFSLLIDGYNLLYASGILARGIGPGTLERARGALLNFLVASLDPEQLRLTLVVFDARTAPPGLPRLVDHQGLRVHFAPNPGDADVLIEELIAAHTSPRRLLVVTADHRLQRAAKRRRATAIDSQLWYAEIVRRRAGRDKPRAQPDVPKPTGPLSDADVAFWLSQFGMDLPETLDRVPATLGAGDAIFPPGFGDELAADMEALELDEDLKDKDLEDE